MQFCSMLSATKGILLRKVKYSDTSLILTFFTEEFGVRSYMYKGAKSKKNKVSLNSLAIIRIVGFGKDSSNLMFVKELHADPSLHSIYTDMKKAGVVLFLNEVLQKVLREESSNPPLFAFIYNSLLQFNSEPFNPNFHVSFLLQLTKYLGFGPRIVPGKFFNLEQGESTDTVIDGVCITGSIYSLFKRALENGIIECNREERQELLQNVLLYYQLHDESVKEIKSKPVLEAVFD